MTSKLRDNPTLSRFELVADGEVAFVSYRLSAGTMALTHTEVPLHLRNRGIGSRLVKAVLEEIRARGLKLVPRCPFIAAFIRSHPEFGDLVA